MKLNAILMRRVSILAALVAFSAQATTYGSPYGKWEPIEIVLTSSKTYANPFKDVDVYADFTSPSSAITRVYGFYDGDGKGGQGSLWKIRFMANKTGTWTWTTTSTDSGNSGLHNKSGSFSVENSSIPGPVSPCPLHQNSWRYANGDHLLWTIGYSLHLAGADRTHSGVGGWQDYLNWLEARRFNGAFFTLQVPSFRSCSTCSKGVAPWSAIGAAAPPTYAFENQGTVDYFVMPWASKSSVNATGKTFNDTDFNRFYLSFWKNLDEILSEMQGKHLIAHVFLYADDTFHPPASSSEERLYWNYVIRRLGGFWNVVYNDGIDLFEYRDVSKWVPEWQNYFQANDPFDHARSSRHGNDDPTAATWRSVQAANSVDPKSIGQWRNLMGLKPAKPVTEDDGIRSLKDSGIPPERFMQLAWWSALAGPGGFGATWAGPHAPGNWFSNLETGSEGVRKVELRNRFILDFGASSGARIPYWELAANDNLVTGAGVYAASKPGSHYLIFFDVGAPDTTQVDLSAAQAELVVTWFDPATGQIVSGGTAAPGSTQSFTKPFGGSAVLYIGTIGSTSGSSPSPPTNLKVRTQ